MATLVTTTREVLAAATLAAFGLASPALAAPIKIGGQKGPLQIGKNGSTNFHGNGRPARLAQHGGFKPGSGGPGYGYKPGYEYGGGYKKYGYGGAGWGYGAAAGVGLAAGLAGAALASQSYEPPPDDACYVIVRKYYLPDGTVRVRHIPRCD